LHSARGRQLVKAREEAKHWFGGAPDDAVLSALFALMLAASAGWLVADAGGLTAGTAAPSSISRGTLQPGSAPTLPGIEPANAPSAPLPHFDDRLRAPMTFDLGSDGRLMATGAILPGTAAVFAAEIAKRGNYVTTIVLASPGGSVADALAMGKLIRKRNLATEVEAGHYCASSCPLVFAGGAVRRAGDRAAIGVHQVSAMAATPLPGDEGMQDAQIVSAVCQRYLQGMGVDPEVWLHAMETPSERLFYFHPEELIRLKLATEVVNSLPRAVANHG
jgi:hypothetical protein